MKISKFLFFKNYKFFLIHFKKTILRNTLNALVNEGFDYDYYYYFSFYVESGTS
jgi:hypothetical protein